MAQRKAAAVSMEEALFERAKKRAERLGMSTFSAYVVQLIRKDLAERGALSIRESSSLLENAEAMPELPEEAPANKVTYEAKKAAKKKPKSS